ncbi:MULTISPECIES: hypothetical protein [Paraburkholderia]|uniref:hypothetical protein n=1 Tax=Paraburkholderia TaxID=1822464 RepID=UPI00225AA195|nr:MULTISPECIES: hypothetical protein [Paraburkholderia]MCX4176851.1 hypothetical protein [Paraburkholderia madseniana]MDQ6464842.1 hypothetical protein [Paraburkholderia madseniana]
MNTHTLVVHIRTMQEATQGISAPLIQFHTGGLRVNVDLRGRISSAPGILRFRPDLLEDAHATAASAPRCVVDVAEDCRLAFVQFLKDCPGTAADFTACVLTATPDVRSQGATIDAANELMAAGMAPAQLRVILADAPPDQPAETAYEILAQFREQHGALGHWRMDAVLRATPALARLKRDHAQVGDVLHGKRDFQARLEEARRAGAEEGSLRMLMRQVLSQRMLLGIADEISNALDALSLPRIPSSAWREEAARFAASRPGGLLYAGEGSADRVQTSMSNSETAQSM